MLNRKQVLSAILIAAFAVSFNPSAVYTAYAENTSSSSVVDDFEYEISEGKAIITEYLGSSSKVSVPSKISGSDVTEIGASAFKGNKKVKTVTLPSKVKRIGKSAFYGCTKLETISFSSKVTSIKANAFYNDSNLDTVNYGGTKDEWSDISIADGNDALTDASINYGSSSSKKKNKYPKTKDDFTVSYTSKISYTGKDPEEGDFGDIKVKFNGETYNVTDIRINEDIKKIQIRELDCEDGKIEEAVKSLTKGDNGLPYTIKPYKITAEDDIRVKMKSKNVKSVKIMLNDELCKVGENEYDYNKDKKKLTFKGDRFKGSYKIQEEDIE